MPLNSNDYRIRPMRVDDIVPLTRTDGYTYLELLERIRAAVSDVIAYCNSFGDDVDDLVETINAMTEKFIADVADHLAEYDAHIDDRKKQVEELHKRTEEFVDEFKSRVITAHFQADATGDNATAPTAQDGVRISMLTTLGAQRLRDALTALITAETTARETAITAAQKTADDAHEQLRISIAQRPTREEGAALYAPHELSRAVYIGSSNATENDKWPRDLSNIMGWAHHNYAIGGGGFTSAANSSFLFQTQNAISGMSESERRSTGYFFVADMLNDIRAHNNVEAQAGTVFRLIRTNFPNARIILVPVFMSTSTMNAGVATQHSAMQRENEADRAGMPFDVEIIRGSQSWFYGTPAESAATNEAGGGVHFTDAGYARARQYIQRYLRGADTWRNYGWEDLAPYAQPQVVRDQTTLRISRTQNFVSMDGAFHIYGGGDLPYDTVFLNVPQWAIPFDLTEFTAHGRNREYPSIYINYKGQIANRDMLKSNTDYDINFTYRLW